MNNVRKHLSAIALLAAPLITHADEPMKNDPQAPGWYVAPSFNYVNADTQRGSGNGKGGSLAFGHHGEIASVEVAGVFTSMRKDQAQIAGGQIALLIGPFIDQEFLARLYGVFALGVVEESNMRGLNYHNGSGLIGDLGVGYRHPIPIQGHLLNLRVDARYRADFQMPPRDAGEPAYFHDVVLNVGVQIPLSSPPPPPPAPPPARVVPLSNGAATAQPAESTAQPQDSTAQPSAETSPPAPSESGASAQPAPPP